MRRGLAQSAPATIADSSRFPGGLSSDLIGMDASGGPADNTDRIPPLRLDLTTRVFRRTIDRSDVTRFQFGIFVFRLVSTFLIGLIVACPLLCQAAQVDSCADGCGTTCLPFETPEAPAPCPEDGISCICTGAVQSTDLRAVDLAPDLLDFGSWTLATLISHPPLALLHISGGGTPLDRSPWGFPQRVHALTQRFRC